MKRAATPGSLRGLTPNERRARYLATQRKRLRRRRRCRHSRGTRSFSPGAPLHAGGDAIRGISPLRGEPRKYAVEPDPTEVSAGATPPAVTARRASVDIVVQLLARGVMLVLGVVTTLVVIRTLGDERFGQWSTILAVAEIVGYLSALYSIEQVAVERAAADHAMARNWLGAQLGLSLVSTLLATIVSCVVLLVIADDAAMRIAGALVLGHDLRRRDQRLPNRLPGEGPQRRERGRDDSQQRVVDGCRGARGAERRGARAARGGLPRSGARSRRACSWLWRCAPG